MILHAPFFISSRLLPALKVGDATLHLERTTWAGLCETAHFILEVPGHEPYEDRRLHSAFGFGSRVDAFDDFLTFLAYSGETAEENEMFPEWVRKWAEEHLEDIREAWGDLLDARHAGPNHDLIED